MAGSVKLTSGFLYKCVGQQRSEFNLQVAMKYHLRKRGPDSQLFTLESLIQPLTQVVLTSCANASPLAVPESSQKDSHSARKILIDSQLE